MKNTDYCSRRTSFGWVAGMVALLTAWDPSTVAAADTKPPNIVFIMADDLGYNDLSCQGATKLSTPGIDRLAKEGMRFTDAHTSAALCCPSRYSVLTGRYSWRQKQTCWASPGAALLIEPGRMTTASLLKQAGYATGCVGKWNLGFGDQSHPFDWNGELKPGPLEVGFDYFFGDIANRTGVYVENHRIVGLREDDPIRYEKQKLPNGKWSWILDSGKSAFIMKNEENAMVLHEKAMAFIEQNKDKPFYLHYVPNNIHTPLTPSKRFRGTSQCGVYGDFVQELDWSVGEILAMLDRLELAENTLVIFSSDNGGEYLIEGFGAGHRSCAPLNGRKGDAWEGGSRVPFLARWPEHIPAGKVSGQLVCLTDLLATFAAVSGQELPAEAGEDSFNALPALLGQEQREGMRKNLVVQSDASSAYAPPQKPEVALWAVREGNWKLVLGQGAGSSTVPGPRTKQFLKFADVGMVNSDFTPDGQLKPGAPPMQLYDLSTDLGEANNVYNAHPETVDHLNKLFEQLRDAGRSRP